MFSGVHFLPSFPLFSRRACLLLTCREIVFDISDGMNRIKAYVTVDPRLQKPVENATTLLPVARKKEGRGKKSTRGKMVRS